ncbi:MAG TPA: 4-hydroxy-tetrahydrodipicolinate synthase [Azospirillaceae bacterium]|nr:4-hydroxy-tetrahydrodipicolinate synthase [Azospirillaceae bacterium]
MAHRIGKTSATRLRGSFVAMVTPFNADGSVDFGAFRDLIRLQEENGTAALFFLGTAGEAAVLTEEEKRRIVVETARMKSGRIPFLYGCTGLNTADAVANVRFARDNGADGAMLTVPRYAGPSEEDAEAYFHEVADAADLPVGIYNNPARLQTDMHWDQLLRLFRHPNIVVYKEGTGRTGQVAQVLREAPDVSFMGNDSPDPDIAAPVMALGGDGLCNAAGNIAPAELALLSRPWDDPDQPARFREAYLRLAPLFWFTYCARSPVALKSLMRAVGLPAGEPRRPLRPLDPQRLRDGVRLLAELGIAERYGYRLPAA